MISNCPGCEADYKEIVDWAKQGLHFAGQGLFEKGHLLILMVDDNGNEIVG